MEERLQKYLASAGVASRRKAEELIIQGRVAVNNKIVTELGTKVETNRDKVYVDDKLVKVENRKRYILLNKPEGYVSSSTDQYDNLSVLHLIENIKERMFTVGRLDKDTTGALLLTNDGDFANKVMHPKYNINKTYIAEVNGRPTAEEMNSFAKGLVIDGKKTAPAKIRIVKEKSKTSILEIIIHEGRNHQVKDMCEAIGHKVVKLQRYAIGNLTIENIKEGCYKEYDINEIKKKLRIM
jgi:pseudouridine synthase